VTEEPVLSPFVQLDVSAFRIDLRAIVGFCSLFVTSLTLAVRYRYFELTSHSLDDNHYLKVKNAA
jgi:hypothetical protein